MVKKSRLTVVGATPADPLAAPADLGKAGRDLWQTIMGEYQIEDAGGLALLKQACAAVDGIAECDPVVARDGLMVRGKFGPREHPLLRHQLGLRSFVCRTLQRLGLSVEPVKPVGRPGRALGVSWDPVA